MPAGVSWGVYLRFSAASLMSMFAGSQTVHMIFRPLENMNELVEEETDHLRKEFVAAMERGDVKLKTSDVPT